MFRSVATIDKPEFVNLQPLDLNPLMSSCEIKVFYLGKNRNRSYISKDVALEMAKNLRGAPIVGYYKEEEEDFSDHGKRIIIDDEGIKFECKTIPYGFVSPDAKVWFKKFLETDDFGNEVEREYLMTTGYLWTGQFKECADVNTNGKPQSMELDEESLVGHWSADQNGEMEFFIVDDAIISKLCILGDDVPPCFEGASITDNQVSANFSLDEGFSKTLFSMMQDLKAVLEGGQKMEQSSVIENQDVEAAVAETSLDNINEAANTDFQKEVETSDVQKDNSTEFEKKEEVENEPKDDDKEENGNNEEDKKKEYSLLKEERDALKAENDILKANYSALEESVKQLTAFKEAIENEKKDELIAKFYMLSDEDKKDVIDNKVNYSYEEIESKLAVICFKKKINFDKEDENDTYEKAVTTFNLNEDVEVPEWIAAVRRNRKKNLK